MEYNQAPNESEKSAAKIFLDSYMEKGKRNGMLLRKTVQETIIRPLNVFTRDMSFTMPETGLPKYFVNIGGNVQELSLHAHAFGRIIQEVDLAASTVRVMVEGQDWDRQNLEMLLNSKYKNKGFVQRGGGLPRFLNLVVGTQVRGFVGRGFKRYLKSGPLMDAFIKSCASYGAMPVDAFATDLRVTLRCMLPYVFCPRNGEYLGIGVSFSNSDFGAGSYHIDMSVMSLRNGNVMPMKTLNANGRGEAHNGGGDGGADDSTELSEETILKMVLAKQGEVADLVGSALQPDKVNAFLDNVADAMDHKISWYQLERFLRGKLTKEEMEAIQKLLVRGAASSELPEVQYDADDKAIMDLWFASNVVASIASKVADTGRKEELQTAAGKLLAS